jgi:transposase-like protein
MTQSKRRRFSAEFKARVALEAAKEQQTLAELGKRFEVSPMLISRWKAEFMENMSSAFGKGIREESDPVDLQSLYSQIGQLKVENDFLKKSLKKTGLM